MAPETAFAGSGRVIPAAIEGTFISHIHRFPVRECLRVISPSLPFAVSRTRFPPRALETGRVLWRRCQSNPSTLSELELVLLETVEDRNSAAVARSVWAARPGRVVKVRANPMEHGHLGRREAGFRDRSVADIREPIAIGRVPRVCEDCRQALAHLCRTIGCSAARDGSQRRGWNQDVFQTWNKAAY